MIQRMYIGPTIPGVAKEGAVFYGDLPKEFADTAKKVSAINNLVIPIEKITEATQTLKEQGSVEYVSYNKVLEYLKGVKQNGI